MSHKTGLVLFLLNFTSMLFLILTKMIFLCIEQNLSFRQNIILTENLQPVTHQQFHLCSVSQILSRFLHFLFSPSHITEEIPLFWIINEKNKNSWGMIKLATFSSINIIINETFYNPLL